MSTSAKPILYFTDLDSTLFQSRATDPAGIVPMTVDAEGAEHGFAREDQHALLQQMISSGIVIPVTARSHEQLERVTGFLTGQAYDLALTDLGATLLVRDNNGDGQWHAVGAWTEAYMPFINLHIRRLSKDFQILEDWLRGTELEGDVKIDLISLGKRHLPLYLSLMIRKDAEHRAEKTAQIRHRFAEPMARASGHYALHESEGQICLWPTFVSKGIAVARLREALRDGLDDTRFDRARDYLGLENAVTFGLGDSTTDIEFMNQSDFMIVPKHSQISRLLATQLASITDKGIHA